MVLIPIYASAEGESAAAYLSVSRSPSDRVDFAKIPRWEEPWSELIEASARQHDLPGPFLRKLLRQESAFFNLAVSRAGAQGIAQFMPGTAAARGLDDPFDPRKAIPAAAALLADLRTRFGNLGLAAAAYNAGSGRVSSWLAGRSPLPAETRAYVSSITGRTSTEWALDAGVNVSAQDLSPRAHPGQGDAPARNVRARPKDIESAICESFKDSSKPCVVRSVY